MLLCQALKEGSVAAGNHYCLKSSIKVESNPPCHLEMRAFRWGLLQSFPTLSLDFKFQNSQQCCQVTFTHLKMAGIKKQPFNRDLK